MEKPLHFLAGEHFSALESALARLLVPTSVAGMIFGSIFMPEREETTRRANFDWAGFVLLCVTVSCTLTALSNGQREGWSSDFVVGLFGTAAVAGTAFVLRELNVLQPLVNLRVLGTGAMESMWGHLPELQMPVAIVTGRSDEKFERIGELILERLPGTANHVRLEGGHALPLEQPAILGGFVAAFAAQHG